MDDAVAHQHGICGEGACLDPVGKEPRALTTYAVLVRRSKTCLYMGEATVGTSPREPTIPRDMTFAPL